MCTAKDYNAFILPHWGVRPTVKNFFRSWALKELVSFYTMCVIIRNMLRKHSLRKKYLYVIAKEGLSYSYIVTNENKLVHSAGPVNPPKLYTNLTYSQNIICYFYRKSVDWVALKSIRLLQWIIQDIIVSRLFYFTLIFH